MSTLPGGTVTFVFTDVEGSTQLLQELGDEGYGRVSSDHRRLVRELQEHAKAQTAPYKYPRIVDFADALPKTASGKIRRAELRGSG